MWDLSRTKWHSDRLFSEFFGFILSVSFHRGSPYWYIIWGISNRAVGGCISETSPHLTDMNNKIHHHYHWLDRPKWALDFHRSFCQLKYPAIASSDFETSVFSRVELSAPRPNPGCPGGPMFSVRVVSLRRLVPILKHQDLAFFPCMT
jgi:hypothetical protein